MVPFEITMHSREHLGTSASRRLRRLEGKVPVVLYGKGEPSITLSVEHSLLSRLAENDAFYSSVLTLKVGNETYQAILKGLKRDPVKEAFLSADFLRIDESKPLHISVPLHFEGEHVAPGVKQSGGVVSYQLTTVELHCLPKNIPEAVVVDISRLGASEHIMLSQLTLPEGVTLAHREDRVIVTILAPRGQSATATATSEETASTT